MQIFTWYPCTEPQGRIDHRTLSAKFGDGYAQIAADGIHSTTQSWPLSFVDYGPQIAAIKAFLDAHGSWRPFLWTPPLGQASTWRSQGGYQLKALGGLRYELSVTLEEVPQP